MVEYVPGKNFWSYGLSKAEGKLAGEKHHRKPSYGTKRRSDERWIEIEQVCPSVKARSDQLRRRPMNCVYSHIEMRIDACEGPDDP